MSAEDARRNFADLLNEVRYQGKEVVITRHGKPVAKLVPVPDDSSAPDPEAEG